MNKKTYQVAFPSILVAVMVSLLSITFFANASNSFAASGKNKSPAVAATSAVDHAESRIKQLKTALSITEGQEVLWTNFTQVMLENAKEIDTMTKSRAENSKNMNAVDNMKFHSQVTEVQLSHMKKLIPPFETLYISMSDDQKKITDTIFRTGKHGKRQIK